jgi:hypothetical protein
MAMLAREGSGHYGNLAPLDSTPVECGRSVDTARRSALQPACAHHFSHNQSRWFWGI